MVAAQVGQWEEQGKRRTAGNLERMKGQGGHMEESKSPAQTILSTGAPKTWRRAKQKLLALSAAPG